MITQVFSNKRMNSLYAAMTLFSFGTGMVSLFVPIYLYTLGYSIFKLSLFFFIYAVFNFLLNLIIFPVIAKYGAKPIFVISFVAAATALILINSLDTHPYLYFVIPFTLAIWDGFIWAAQHYHTANIMDQHLASRQISTNSILNSAAGVTAPLLGGVIASSLGVQSALTISTTIILLAIAPLFWSFKGWLHTPERFRFRWLKIRPDLIANFSFQIQTSINFFLWPLFIFLFIDEYRTIGIIVSLAFVAGIIAKINAGSQGDKGKKKRILKHGLVATAIVHLSRPFVSSLAPIAALSMVSSVSDSYVQVSWTSLYYSNAKHSDNTLQYIANMEVIGDIARIFFTGLLVLLSVFFAIKPVMIGAFFVAAFFTMFNSLIVDRAART